MAGEVYAELPDLHLSAMPAAVASLLLQRSHVPCHTALCPLFHCDANAISQLSQGAAAATLSSDSHTHHACNYCHLTKQATPCYHCHMCSANPPIPVP